MRSDEFQSISLSLIMENCLPFTDDVMVVLVQKCVQQTHLLALHLETLGYIPHLMNALNGFVYFINVVGINRTKQFIPILCLISETLSYIDANLLFVTYSRDFFLCMFDSQ